MEKRITAALLLCVLFMFAFAIVRSSLFPRSPVPPEHNGAGVATEDGADSGAGGGETEEAATAPAEPPRKQEEPPKAPKEGFPLELGEDARAFDVSTDTFLITLDPKGAAVKEVRLKRITIESEEDPEDPVNWLPILTENEPGKMSLVWETVPAAGSTAIRTGEALWEYVGEEVVGEEVHHVFRISPGDGTRIRKAFVLADGRHDIRVRVQVETVAPEVAGTRLQYQMVGAAGIVAEGYPGMDDQTFAVARLAGQSDLRHWNPGQINKHEGTLVVADDVQWASVVSKYFAAALLPTSLPDKVQQLSLETLRFPALMKKILEQERITEEEAARQAKKKIGFALDFYDSLPPVGTSLNYEFLMFLGLKEKKLFREEPYVPLQPLLSVTGRTLCGLDFIVVPISAILLAVLNFLDGVFGNYGVAIILLTIMVKVALFPLTRRQQVSMAEHQRKMARFKPQLDELRKKYKNNKQKLNQETMKFFKEHGINPVPLGGCLPMFAIMPVFLGLFYILGTAVELRQAPFVAWITDLSRPDRLLPVPDISLFGCIRLTGLNVLPILMAGAMIIQQSQMPKSDDPQQRQTQQMMTFMPIFMVLILYNFAAGLSLYMLTNSIFSMVEQRVIRRSMPSANPSS